MHADPCILMLTRWKDIWKKSSPIIIFYVVYTKEAETADQYIEKTVHRIGRQYQVTVATSDGLEQVIIMGQGAHRISAQGLKKEIEDTEKNSACRVASAAPEQQDLSL